MRLNETTVLRGEKVWLVPYLREHVPTYNAWMQDAWLREMTRSEPLTLAQEYEMQASWHVDEAKLTFIVLDAARADPTLADLTRGMCGDVNIFLSALDDDDDDGDGGGGDGGGDGGGGDGGGDGGGGAGGVLGGKCRVYSSAYS